MRLLSFHHQVETTLAMLRPEASGGWKRRVDYDTGEALAWHAGLGLTLSLRSSAVGEGRFGLLTRWLGPTGEVLSERTFFCGESPFDWQNAAESVAEAMPEPAFPVNSTPGAEGLSRRVAQA